MNTWDSFTPTRKEMNIFKFINVLNYQYFTFLQEVNLELVISIQAFTQIIFLSVFSSFLVRYLSRKGGKEDKHLLSYILKKVFSVYF